MVNPTDHDPDDLDTTDTTDTADTAKPAPSPRGKRRKLEGVVLVYNANAGIRQAVTASEEPLREGEPVPERRRVRTASVLLLPGLNLIPDDKFRACESSIHEIPGARVWLDGLESVAIPRAVEAIKATGHLETLQTLLRSTQSDKLAKAITIQIRAVESGAVSRARALAPHRSAEA